MTLIKAPISIRTTNQRHAPTFSWRPRMACSQVGSDRRRFPCHGAVFPAFPEADRLQPRPRSHVQDIKGPAGIDLIWRGIDIVCRQGH